MLRPSSGEFLGNVLLKVSSHQRRMFTSRQLNKHRVLRQGLDKSSGLCHCQMDASAQSRWLLGSGEGTRTASRIVGEAIGALAGGERAPAQATGRGAAGNKRSAAPFSK